MKPNWPAIAFVAADAVLFGLSIWGSTVAPWVWLRVLCDICATSFGAFLLLWLLALSHR